MVGVYSVPLKVLLAAAFVLVFCDGSFLLTTPLRWTAGEGNAICLHALTPLMLDAEIGEVDKLRVKVMDRSACDGRCKPVAVVNFYLQPDQSTICQEAIIPHGPPTRLSLVFVGQLGGVDLAGRSGKEVTRKVDLVTRTNVTLLQTDKAVYKPGQDVKFRVMSLYGSDLLLIRGKYPEIWVTSPSKTRIAHWKNVNNSAGLVHLGFQLDDGSEQGMYEINVKSTKFSETKTTFEVREYVLARFEVKVTTPDHISARKEILSIGVCAEYFFGQPVRGNATVSVSNDRKKCMAKLEKSEPINGCQDIHFRTEDLRASDCTVGSLKVEVVVEEEGTRARQTGERSIWVERQLYRFQTVYKDLYKKPNLPYTLRTKLSFVNGTAAKGVPVEVCAAGRCVTRPSGDNGTVGVVVSAQKLGSVKMSTLDGRVDEHPATYCQYVSPYFSPSNSSLAIQVPEDELECEAGQESRISIPVFFSTNNQSRATIFGQIVSRGKIQASFSEKVNLNAGELPINAEHHINASTPNASGSHIVTGVVILNITLPPTASPQAKLVIWYKRHDGEVVSDSAHLNVERCLGFGTSLEWSVARGQVGEEIALSLLSEAHAVCSIGVVDRSTEQASRGTNKPALEDPLSIHDARRSWSSHRSQVHDEKYCAKKNFKGGGSVGASSSHIFASDYVDTLKMFDDSGLLVITDLTLETRPCQKISRRGFLEVERYSFSAASQDGDQTSRKSEEVELGLEGRTRTWFPETWLWDLVVMPLDGAVDKMLTLPDTVTEWVGQALCAHEKKGVGLSERASITVFTPFFTDVSLPPTVQRGEIFPLKISVFNNLNENLPIISGSSRIEEKEGNPTHIRIWIQKTSCVAPRDKAVHFAKVKMLELGDVNLTVISAVDYKIPVKCETGTKFKRRDTLIKSIKVEAEGFQKEKTWTRYVCTEDLAKGDKLKSDQLSTSRNTVEGSERGWVTAEGDLFALPIETMDSLIRVPHGSGEQNMVIFAPMVHVMHYLKDTGQNTTENTKKILRFLRIGYRRQLLYRRSSGAYSAFGNADRSGSTWLTAIVLKSFALAAEFITIDIPALKETSKWLSNSEIEDGCIVPKGKVIHKGLKGGVSDKNSSVPLTAFVLAALLEAGARTNMSIVKGAIRCLLSERSKDPHTMALKAYALIMAENRGGKDLLRKLLALAVEKENVLYWKPLEGTSWSKSQAIETTGYAVLAMLNQDPDKYKLLAKKAIQWLCGRRSSKGGFWSMQDTTVALQAMAKYETHSNREPTNVRVTFKARSFSATFNITNKNKLLQQRQELPVLPTDVDVTLTGRGCAIVQTVFHYNVPEAEPSDAFSLRVHPTNDPDGGCKEKRIEVCVAYLLPDGKSNMAVIAVKPVSGFSPEMDDLKAVVRRNPKVVKRYGVDGNIVYFYIEEFTAKEVCVSFRVVREVEVEDAKPGSVVVYDYHEPEFYVSQTFQFRPMESCPP
ncbi:alpha-2-macroglobulin-like protein 1 isoform X2 [Penaeus vannamei]|uniref:alpha-2-macroglobulin-like protein 1 isoform X2 n=1 Tax=Penaeus vannamei TaxID=6689 RepID=UPI00387F4673